MTVQVNLDMTDSMGPGKLVRHKQNLSYTYDTYWIWMGLGPSISSVIAKSLSYSGPSYPSSPVFDCDDDDDEMFHALTLLSLDVFRRNVVENIRNDSYLKSCRYNSGDETDRFCPVFTLETIVKEAGEDYDDMAVLVRLPVVHPLTL